jgi:predicted Mrr-cat superfamily restriction endonuclease
MKAGDDVGIFASHDRALLTGRITGEYSFDGKAAHGLFHRRPVSWHSVIDRSTVQPPASLQDVRPVFRVRRAHP